MSATFPDCDVCNERPATHTVIVCQTDTSVCDRCAGYDAGAYGEDQDSFLDDPRHVPYSQQRR